MGPDDRRKDDIAEMAIASGLLFILMMALALALALTGCYAMCPCNFN